MPHEQIIPAEKAQWDHRRFYGRRMDRDDSYWGVEYVRFLNPADVKAGMTFDLTTGEFGVINEMCARFFWDPEENSGAGGFKMNDSAVYRCLKAILSEPISPADLANTINLENARLVMSGVQMWDFVVSPLEVTGE